jgi:ABC-2 type transport system permease protein
MISSELFLRFLSRNLRLCTFVAAGSGLLAFFLATIFPEMDRAGAVAVATSWPPLMKKMFGDPLLAFTNVYAWLHLQVFHITFWLIYGGLASLLASRILAAEAEEKTLDILLSVPISRTGIVLSRLLALSLLSALSSIPVIVGCGLGIWALGIPLHLEPLILATSAGVLLALVMAALTLFASVWVPRQTHCILTVLGLVGLLFLLEEMLVELVPALRSVAVLNPFRYYGAAEILVHDAGAGWGPLVLFSIFLGLVAFSMVGFARRDIPT